MRKVLYALTIAGLLAVGLYAQGAGGAFLPTFNYTIPGNWTFSGTNTFSGANTFSGTNAFSGVATLTSPVFSKSETRQLGGVGKVGGSAGWVLSAANDLPYIATMAASQTAGTLVVKIDGLQVGATITGFRIVAQIESAGGAVTLDAALRAVTNVAAEPTDAAIGTGITQIAVSADTASSVAKTGLTEVVTSGKSYYLLITGTTAAATDIILQYPEITVTEI